MLQPYSTMVGKLSPLLSGGPALRQLQFPGNVFLCLPNASESVKHKFWDCIQARRAWRWTTCIMHELCGVRTRNYYNFNWKQALFGKRIPKKYDSQNDYNFGIFLGELLFEPFGSNAMTKCFIMNNGMLLKSRIAFETNSLSMPKLHGTG